MHPVNIVQAGPTFWPLEESAEVLRAYGAFIAAAPRELNGFFAFATVPPVPAFPEELHGRKVAGIVWCHTGTAEQAAADMAPMLAVGNPLLHGVGEMPYPALQGFFDPLYPTGLQWYWRADFVRELSDEAIERHVEFGEKMPAGHSTMHLYPIDGAVHDVASTDTAFSYRDVAFAEVIVGVDPDPANAEAITRWTVEYWEATHPYSAGGAYVNFMMDEGQERVKATYGANYDRLTRVKAKYDPKNLFRVNQNIQPGLSLGLASGVRGQRVRGPISRSATVWPVRRLLPEGYELDDDADRVDLDAVHDFLALSLLLGGGTPARDGGAAGAGGHPHRRAVPPGTAGRLLQSGVGRRLVCLPGRRLRAARPPRSWPGRGAGAGDGRGRGMERALAAAHGGRPRAVSAVRIRRSPARA